MRPTKSRQFETVEELRARWKISKAQVFNLLHQGLPSVQIGRSRRFDPVEVDQWLADRQDHKAA